jgi:hypothetical protein
MEPTYLDLVRTLGDITQKRCDPECSPLIHRHEAAITIGLLLANPELARAIANKADAAGARL